MENLAVENVLHREIDVVTAEIKELKRQAQATAMVYVIEIGRRLKEAKSFLPHGEWSEWLQTEVEFSQSTAINFMKIFEEYGSDQLTLFGAVTNSQTIANLPYTKALKLIAIPAEERESFAEEVDAENISVKELETAIREKKEAQKKAKQLEEKVKAMEEATERVSIAEAEAEEAKKHVQVLEEELAKAKEETLKEKQKKAKANPKLPPEEMNRLRQSIEKETVEKTEKRLEEELLKAKDRAEKAENEAKLALTFAKNAEKEMAEMKNKLKTARPEVTEFKILFDTAQENIKKLKGMLAKLNRTDPETAAKLKNALHALAEYLEQDQ
jgi:chromosome segregation ATPase